MLGEVSHSVPYKEGQYSLSYNLESIKGFLLFFFSLETPLKRGTKVNEIISCLCLANEGCKIIRGHWTLSCATHNMLSQQETRAICLLWGKM